jgi:hypothetical protein
MYVAILLVAKPEVKRPLGRPSRRCVDNIKIDLREIGWDVMDWIDLAQDRDQRRTLVNTYWTFGLHKILGNSLVAEKSSESTH